MRSTESATSYVLSVFRIVVGFLFACHGAAKLFGLFGTDTVAVGVWPYWYAGVIELVGGILLILGLGTRIVALICSGEMAYAYFVVHQPRALWPMENGGELAALFSWSFLLIAVAGPGAWALDTWLHRSRRRTPTTAPIT
ncbi:putative oxidoreductase [Streptosporangium becharense]|uniref:Putative oxidoreductase n=1 Tax=Streptosporangium becharense TaxID=1816182 RepID=A0A7W9ME52_9ACTN|nr:DoxX family protein [Streptosporangium becharense]MBB2910785.1 putative oxidoreductase [Streptosporangium becharense]MBB5817480.1 putative oxidoreductase [Streptosporangium becharense]